MNDFVYSNDTCSAFLAAIVRSFEEIHPRGYLGRTAIQKLTYFAKALGVPIPCTYNIYTFGPYSDTVTFAMESLMADDVVVDRSQKLEYSNYRLGPNSLDLLQTFEEEIGPYIATINRVVEALGRFNPQQLEVIATLHFICRRQRQILQLEPQKEHVIQEFKNIKGDKFSEDEVSAWYDALARSGVIGVRASAAASRPAL